MSVVFYDLDRTRGYSLEADRHVNITIDPGTINYALSGVLRERGQPPKLLFHEKFNLKTCHWRAEADDHPVIYPNLDWALDQYVLPHADDIKYFLIEKQLKTNYNATRLMQHTISWATNNLMGRLAAKAVIEFDAKLKSRMFGMKTMPYRELKSWAVEKAAELCEERGDSFGLSVLRTAKKSDDVADTIVQEAALEVWLQSYNGGSLSI